MLIQPIRIEDNPFDVEIFERYCGRQFENLNISVVGSLKEGRPLLQQKPFDIVFTDLNMTDSIGASAVYEIRRILPGNIPLIVLTGIATNVTRDECKKAGATGFMLKSDFSAEKFVQYMQVVGYAVDE